MTCVDRPVPVRPSAATRAVVDGLALLAFVAAGVVQHDEGLDLTALARTGLPLLGAWFLLAPLLGTYRRPGWVTLVLNWASAVPAALVVRSIVRGGPWGSGLVRFGLVAMAFTLLFLAVGRFLVLLSGWFRERARRGSLEPR
jgi:hypothetical protein